MSKNFYEEGFPDDDPTDELPVLSEAYVGGDDDRTEIYRALPQDEDTGELERGDIPQVPTLEDRDETASELIRDIADRDAKLANLEAELANLKLQWRQTSDELAARNAELDAARAASRSHQEAAAQAQDAIRDRDQTIARLSAELDRAREKTAALEDNARALEQQIVERETVNGKTAVDAPARSESAVTARLREEPATLANHIESRNAIWRERAAEVAAKTTRIRELERDIDDTAVADAAPRPEREMLPPQMICLTGDGPETHSLDASEILIGRGSHCGIHLTTHYASREHARVVVVDERCLLEDLGSRNGVFVNSVRIERQALNDNDLITIGDTQFRFRAARTAP